LCGLTLAIRICEASILAFPAVDGLIGWLTGIMLAAALITLVGVLAWVWRSPCVMAGCSATRQAAFAPEQNHDEQAESDQGRKAGGLEQTTDGKGVETACGVETVAHQPDMIGPAADAASTGIDQREPQIGRIEPDARQGARNAAVRRVTTKAAAGCA
jgi:hypothetical protein